MQIIKRYKNSSFLQCQVLMDKHQITKNARTIYNISEWLIDVFLMFLGIHIWQKPGLYTRIDTKRKQCSTYGYRMHGVQMGYKLCIIENDKIKNETIMILTVVLKSNFGEALKWYKCICIYDTTASVDINVFRVNYANEN